MAASDSEKSRLDDAARAGWLYYIAGNTQDEIAKKLNVSRATAQRLVSLSLTERLITFRLEHPITACMELAARLTERFGLDLCEIAPTDPSNPNTIAGVAERTATLLETTLRNETSTVIALGTGRTLRAAVELVPPMDAARHKLVSLVGTISPDGSASIFDAAARLADTTGARHYPLPLPLFATSMEEREQLLRLNAVARVRSIAENADLRIVGIGQLDHHAQMLKDSFITSGELRELQELNAAGEVIGWAYDADGNIISGGSNARITSASMTPPASALTVGAALGRAKVAAIRAALKSRIINGLVTDEATAQALLKP